jgi:hypothetical protein
MTSFLTNEALIGDGGASMSRFSVGVIFVGAWLLGLVILMPPWSRTLSTPYGGVREFTWGAPIFAKPEPSGSKPWQVAADLVTCEILVVAGACLTLLYIDRTPHGSTHPRRATNLRERTLRHLALAALGGHVVSLCVPAIKLGSDWLSGYQATYLAFVGIVSPGQIPATYYVACLLGAAANILLVAGYAATLTRRYGAGFAFSSTATALTIAVLLPLAASHKLNGLLIGHPLWVASAGLLTFISGRLWLGSSSSGPSAPG